MDIEVADYLRRFQAGEFNILHVGLLYVVGFASVEVAARLVSSRIRLERPGTLVLSALAPFVGLVLTTTVYPCVGCSAPEQCEIVTVGVPFPQALAERGAGSRTNAGPCWWSLTETSRTALAGNFAVGTLGIPLVVTFFRPRRRTPTDQFYSPDQSASA